VGAEYRMKNFTKKIAIILFIGLLSVASLMSASKTYSLGLTSPEKALLFLTDVAQIDVSKYNVTLVNDIHLPNDLVGVIDETLKYSMCSNVSQVDALFTFYNGTLLSCEFNVIRGSPLFSRSVGSNLDYAKAFIQAYQNYSKAAYISQVQTILNSTSNLMPTTTTSGIMKLDISIQPEINYTTLTCTFVLNGLDSYPNTLGISFRNGIFNSFTDMLNRYQIGSTDFNISKQKAISLAKVAVQNYSYTVGNGAVSVTDFNIVDNATIASAYLTSSPSRGINVLYPIWNIYLPLDKVYPGGVTYFQVLLWADTGQVSKINALGSYGEPFPNNTNSQILPMIEPSTYPSSTPQATSRPSSTTSSEPNSNSSQSPTSPSPLLQPSLSFSAHSTDNGSSESSALQFVAVIVVVAVAVVAAALLLKRKTKQ
jgi:hypothetical protein